MKLFNYQCIYCLKVCRRDQLTIDHVIPRVYHGRNARENLVLACANCNHKRGNASMIYTMAYRQANRAVDNMRKLGGRYRESMMVDVRKFSRGKELQTFLYGEKPE